MANAFLRPVEEYTRNINPIKQYVEQAAKYLSITKGISIDEASSFIMTNIQNNKFPNLKDPTVRFFERGKNGDRYESFSTLSSYINTVVKGGYILVPSGTVYLHPSMKVSKIAGYLSIKSKKRSIAKKEMMIAEANKNYELYVEKNNEQTSTKLFSNAFSGAFCAEGNIATNPSAHSTLTSTTRCISSFGNASNERIISGNRHYWSKHIVINNLISCSMIKNKDLLESVMEKYNLHYPTAEDVLECIKYSSRLYGSNPKYDVEYLQLANNLTPLERASFVYSGDLYHLRKHNEEFVRTYILELSKKVVEHHDNGVEIASKADGEMMQLAHQICNEEAKGRGKDYPRMKEEGVLDAIVGTVLNIERTIEKYRDFIAAFFLTDNIPPTIAYLPQMMRRCAMLSDTDSTCFATDKWIDWIQGGIKYNAESMAIGGAVAYMATQSLAHILASFSANINTDRDNMFTLAMKGEFVFKIFVITSVAKHYFATQDVKEGNVFDKPKLEIKGVHLKNSAVPARIVKQAEGMMKKILFTIPKGEQLSATEMLKEIADLERQIKESVLKGEREFLKGNKIKDSKAYSLEADKSPYRHYTLWREVFEPKYGQIEIPPFYAMSLPTTLRNKTDTKNWLASMEDREFANRMEQWFIRNGKTEIGTFYLPSSYLSANGMPKELISIIDTKRLMMDLTLSFRIIMESMGIFIKPGMLVSEMGY